MLAKSANSLQLDDGQIEFVIRKLGRCDNIIIQLCLEGRARDTSGE